MVSRYQLEFENLERFSPILRRDPLRARWIGPIIGLVATGVSVGYAASQGTPAMPNTVAGARAVSGAQAAMLPYQRMLSALEQQGGAVQSTPLTMSYGDLKNKARDVLKQYKAGGKKDAGLAAQYDVLNQALRDNRGKDTVQLFQDSAGKFIPPEVANANFAGYGTADVEGQMAKKFADIQTELGAKYGTQFADEARKEQEMADPLGTQARKAEYDLIQKGINDESPISPLSTGLETGIDAQLKAGSGLDPMSRDLLNQAVAKSAAARGGGASAEDVAQSMSTGMEGEARRQAAETKAQGFLNSGSTPEDIQYRVDQQNLANLGNFVGGRTPQSQFQNLTGISQGTTPFNPGQPLPSMPGGAAAAGSQFAVGANNANLQQQAGQANPWMAGISTLLQGVNVVQNAVR